jgi:hypothetical protein
MKRLIPFLFFLLLSFSLQRSFAQCSVCKQSVESADADNKMHQRANGLNKGILYLMGIPYAMGGVAFYIWWKNKKKNGPEEPLPF